VFAVLKKKRELKKTREELDKEIAAFYLSHAEPTAAQEDVAVQELQPLYDRMGELELRLKVLLHKRLVSSARRWYIYVPNNFWEKQPKFPLRKQILTEEGEHRIREQRVERRLVVWAAVVGFSSLVQAVYAVLSFHTRNCPK
jgi:hypothetical protein